MTVSELRRLKDLEVENSELKRLLADALLDNDGLKGLLEKDSYRLPPAGMR
jgi:putative transposase